MCGRPRSRVVYIENEVTNLSPVIICFCVAIVWLHDATSFSNSSMRSSWPTFGASIEFARGCFSCVLFALNLGGVIYRESFG